MVFFVVIKVRNTKKNGKKRHDWFNYRIFVQESRQQ